MKKIALPFMVITLALIGSYLVFFDASEKVEQPQEIPSSEQAPELGLTMPPSEPELKPEPKPEHKIDLTKMEAEPGETYELALTFEEREAIKEWQVKVGYGELGTGSDYDTYHLGILKELSDQGDPKAMHSYGVHLVNHPELERQKGVTAEECLYKAGVYGHIPSLKRLSEKYRSQYFDTDNPEDKLKSFAYLQLAHKRGDLISRFELYGYGGFENAEEVAQINALADKLYEDLASKRAALGLPEFDNTYPPAIEKVVYDFKVNGCASKEVQVIAYQGNCANLKPDP